MANSQTSTQDVSKCFEENEGIMCQSLYNVSKDNPRPMEPNEVNVDFFCAMVCARITQDSEFLTWHTIPPIHVR